MKPTDRIHFLSHRAANSRKNFGGKSAAKRGESNFLRAFERAYFAGLGSAALAAREFSLSDHGVADLVWIAVESKTQADEFTAFSLEKQLRRRHLHAFEGKLKDWRKALKQAYRYRYFADKSIVVMPPAGAAPALCHLDAFREANVGLWSFDAATGRIRKHYTPTKVAALNTAAKAAAIRALSSKVDLGLLRKKLNAPLH